MPIPRWDTTNAPTASNVDRILTHLSTLDSVPDEAMDALRGYITVLRAEHDFLVAENHRLRNGKHLPSVGSQQLTVNVGDSSYTKEQPIVSVTFVCQECSKVRTRQQLPGGIPKYCPGEGGEASECQRKARQRAVDKQREKRQADRQG